MTLALFLYETVSGAKGQLKTAFETVTGERWLRQRGLRRSADAECLTIVLGAVGGAFGGVLGLCGGLQLVAARVFAPGTAATFAICAGAVMFFAPSQLHALYLAGKFDAQHLMRGRAPLP